DVRFPGMLNFGNQASWRTTGSVTLRSTLASNFVNELIGGWANFPEQFSTNLTTDMFADQQGVSLNLAGLITGATTDTTRSPRNTPNWSIDDNISWLRGSHSFTFGGSFLQVTHTQNGDDVVPTVGLGLNTTNDPAAAMFTTANFPGASTTLLGEARSLYAILTGRVTQIAGTARLNNAGTEYVYLGNLLQRD